MQSMRGFMASNSHVAKTTAPNVKSHPATHSATLSRTPHACESMSWWPLAGACSSAGPMPALSTLALRLSPVCTARATPCFPWWLFSATWPRTCLFICFLSGDQPRFARLVKTPAGGMLTCEAGCHASAGWLASAGEVLPGSDLAPRVVQGFQVSRRCHGACCGAAKCTTGVTVVQYRAACSSAQSPAGRGGPSPPCQSQGHRCPGDARRGVGGWEVCPGVWSARMVRMREDCACVRA